MNTLAFDQVVISKPAGEVRPSSAEFLALPIDERIGYIIGRKVAFFCGKMPIERAEALRSMKAA